MHGSLRVSLRTISRTTRVSPTSIKATYLPSTARCLSDNGRRRKPSRGQPPRNHDPYWLGQKGTFSKTIVVSDVTSIDESALLATLRGWPSQPGEKAAEAVFLVTPKLAHLFEPGGAFLKKAMTRIYGNDLMPEVSSLVAIVDKIPGRWMPEERRISDCEGFALMLKAPARSTHMKYLYPKPESTPDANSASSKASLEFRSAIGRMTADGSPNMEVVYKVALANTLFVNGHEATMFYTKWDRRFDTLKPKESRPLSIFRFLRPHGPMIMEFSHVPLVPLTEPRAVTTAIGNIISGIQVDDKVMPASTELEAAVMGSVKSMAKENALDSRTRIYALISGNRAQEDPIPHSADYHPFTQFVRELKFRAGLYQVIGGGGGWGNKRGLLALDPTNPFDGAVKPSPTTGVDGDPSITAPDTETSLARSGQTIQFYQLQHNLIKASNLAAIASDDDRLNPQSAKNMSSHLLTRGTMWDLARPTLNDLTAQNVMIGTIPTQDVEIVLPASRPRTANPPPPVELWGVFGALSETGIQLEIHRHLFLLDIHSHPLEEHSSIRTSWTETAPAEIVRTISVPHSYVAFKHMLPGTSKRARDKRLLRKPQMNLEERIT